MTSNDTHPLFEAAREAPLDPVPLGAVEAKLATRTARRPRPMFAVAIAAAAVVLLVGLFGLDLGEAPTPDAPVATTAPDTPTLPVAGVPPALPGERGGPEIVPGTAPQRAVSPRARPTPTSPTPRRRAARPAPVAAPVADAREARAPVAPAPRGAPPLVAPISPTPERPRQPAPRIAAAPGVAPEPLPPPYQPRAIREFLRVDWERWEDRELPAAVARMVVARDPVGLLAALDALPVQGTEPDLLDWRASLRSQLTGVSTADGGRPDPGPR